MWVCQRLTRHPLSIQGMLKPSAVDHTPTTQENIFAAVETCIRGRTVPTAAADPDPTITSFTGFFILILFVIFFFLEKENLFLFVFFLDA